MSMNKWPPPAVVKPKNNLSSEKPHEILGVSENATLDEIRKAQKAFITNKDADTESLKRVTSATADMKRRLREQETSGSGGTEAQNQIGSDEQSSLRITHDPSLPSTQKEPSRTSKRRGREVKTTDVIALSGPETPKKPRRAQIEDFTKFEEDQVAPTPTEIADDELLATSLATSAPNDPHLEPVTKEEGPTTEERLTYEEQESASTLDKKLRQVRDAWAGYEPELGPSRDFHAPEPGVSPSVEERIAHELNARGIGSNAQIFATEQQKAIEALSNTSTPNHEVSLVSSEVIQTNQEAAPTPAPYWPKETEHAKDAHPAKGHGGGHHGGHGHGKKSVGAMLLATPGFLLKLVFGLPWAFSAMILTGAWNTALYIGDALAKAMGGGGGGGGAKPKKAAPAHDHH